jgi:hypothetical protein
MCSSPSRLGHGKAAGVLFHDLEPQRTHGVLDVGHGGLVAHD